jgi:hypothetical protein
MICYGQCKSPRTKRYHIQTIQFRVVLHDKDDCPNAAFWRMDDLRKRVNL